METKRINIDQLYRQKEMQLEPLPFGAWYAMNQKLHGTQSNNNTPDGKISSGSSFYVLIAAVAVVISGILFHYAHSKSATSSVSTNTTSSITTSTTSLTSETPQQNPTQKTNNNSISSTIKTKQNHNKNSFSASNTDTFSNASVAIKTMPKKRIVEVKRHFKEKVLAANVSKKESSIFKKHFAEKAIKKDTTTSNNSSIPEIKTTQSKAALADELLSNLIEEKPTKKHKQHNAQKVKPTLFNGLLAKKAATETTSTEQNQTPNPLEANPVFLNPKPIELAIFPPKIISPIFLLKSNNSNPIKTITFENNFKDSSSKKHFDLLKGINGGIKAGYEFGTSSNPYNKSVVAGYLQYKISNHTSIAIQPTIKMGNGIGYNANNVSYYQLTGTNVITVFDSMQNSSVVTQHYDSILVTRNATQSSNVQMELLLSAKYRFNNHFAFNAGIGFNKGTLPYATETKTNLGNFQQVDSFFANPGTTPTIDTTNSFIHSSRNIAQYNTFNGPTQSSNPLRINYFASVEYWYKHWLIELAITQQLTNLNSLNDKNLQNSYQQPYIRIMTGWRFGK